MQTDPKNGFKNESKEWIYYFFSGYMSNDLPRKILFTFAV
jgi:hypothetical protein